MPGYHSPVKHKVRPSSANHIKQGRWTARRPGIPQDGFPASSPNDLRNHNRLRPVPTVSQCYNQGRPGSEESVLDTRYLWILYTLC